MERLVWNTPEALEQWLEQAFPDLHPLAPLKLLGEGFSSIAVETSGGIVFRIAKTAEAGEGYAREAQVLPRLKSLIPAAIPQPEWFMSGSQDFPYGVIGYQKLRGETLDPLMLRSAEGAAEYARQMGAILNALHGAPLELVPQQPAFESRTAAWSRLCAAVLPALQEALSPDEYAKVVGWWNQFLPDRQMGDYIPHVTHGDFWYGNLLVEGQRVVAVLDFQEIGAGDPARDFVPLLYLGEPFMRRALTGYQAEGGPVDPGFEHRLWNLWALREFGGLEYSLRYQDREEFVDSLEKIRRGPILSPRGLDGWGDEI